VQALGDVGLSLDAYALLNIVIDKVGDLVWVAVGVLIFLRRSNDRMALLISLFLVAFGTVTRETVRKVSGALAGYPYGLSRRTPLAYLVLRIPAKFPLTAYLEPFSDSFSRHFGE
jgi:hypothetical protein